MPELGETWAVNNSDNAAVVVATGPSIVRLVDRYGRRITVSPGGWQAWSRVAPAPSPTSHCHQCSQVAYFRFVAWDGEFVWSCEDHLPYGVPTRLPGDSPQTPVSRPEFPCLECQSRNVHVLADSIPLRNRRSTIQCMCADCHARWSPILSLGLTDDGARLAEDLHAMLEAQPLQRINIGFTAHRNLCRALNIGDVAHLRGVPVQRDPTIADQLTLVFIGGVADAGRPLSPEPTLYPLDLHIPFAPLAITPQSEWKRRTLDGRAALSCTVVSAGPEVTFTVLGKTRTQSRRDFLQHWLPGSALARPAEASLWMHRETTHFVQVLEGTAIHAAHQQVHYLNYKGQRETTALRTFRRLYRELPTPPEDHLWYSNGVLYEVDRIGSTCHLRPVRPGDATPPTGMNAQTLYSTCRPLVFSEQVTLNPTLAIRSGSTWLNKSSPSGETVTVKDVGIVESSGPKYVRFTQQNGDASMLEVGIFCDHYEYLPPPPPCQVGETWVSLTDPTRQCVIRKDDNPPLSQATVQWRDGELEVLSHEKLTSEYEKLDIRSYWELLDSDDSA